MRVIKNKLKYKQLKKFLTLLRNKALDFLFFYLYNCTPLTLAKEHTTLQK